MLQLKLQLQAVYIDLTVQYELSHHVQPVCAVYHVKVLVIHVRLGLGPHLKMTRDSGTFDFFHV